MPLPEIQHVFVLVLENRAFDHMLGFSAITGTDAETGKPTSLNGLSGNESNSLNGVPQKVTFPADDSMPVDPGHEFLDVLCQLAGPSAKFQAGASYPKVDNSGFLASFARTCTKDGKQCETSEIMKCFSADQLPVLNALAREFAVCDNWYASMPGPTWPNRMFFHGASSNGLDHSPTVAEIALWEVAGFAFPNGDVFDRLAGKGLSRRLYAGDKFPMIGALKGVKCADIHPFKQFAADLKEDYPYSYTFIEPSYNLSQDYRQSTSQHPLSDIRLGEGLIKATYEAIRGSSIWPKSLLIIAWDEHGGFYDHVIPPRAISPADTAPRTGHNKYGFTFEQYGVRVPAVVISPLIPKNTIDHRLYDHASVPKTLELLFALPALTNRDGAANSVLPLLSLAAPRGDTPAQLPSPAPPLTAAAAAVPALTYGSAPPETARPQDSVDDGNLPIVLQAAMHQDLEISPPAERNNIIARVAGLKTRADAANYLNEVAAKQQPQPAHAGAV